MVNEMMSGIGDTLKRLEKVAKKYDFLGSNSKRRQICQIHMVCGIFEDRCLEE